MSGVQQIHVKRTEEGMRLDRWFKVHFPTLGHGKLSKLLRTGQVRVNGARVKSNARLESGQMIRVPPLNLNADTPDEIGEEAKPKPLSAADKAYFESMILFEDKHLYVLNKPAGLAVQGGSCTTRHVDGLLMGLAAEMYDRPRLVHRLDRETSGCLVLAKRQTRSVRKIYWALVNGVPKPEQGKVDKPLIKGGGAGEERMHEAHNPHDDGAQRAVTHYAVIDKAPPAVAWVSLKPVTGRQHQLRAHMAMIGQSIVGDGKYGDLAEMPDGMSKKLHLHARRITFPHPKGGTVDISAPIPGHMRQSFETCGFDPDRFDIPEAGEEDQQA